MRPALAAVLAALVLSLACGGAPAAPPADAGTPDASTEVDAGAADAGSKAAGCASVFGSELTNAFGRLDGVITAVVTPADTTCPLPNSDHVVVQVRMDGGVYRVVVNVKSTGPDPDVRFQTLAAPAKGPAWAEGWHVGTPLDYAQDLGVHSDGGFTAVPMGPLVDRVAGALEVGMRVSAWSTSSGGTYASSSHLVHRNGKGNDGALVVQPDGPSPRWLLFHFPDQSF